MKHFRVIKRIYKHVRIRERVQGTPERPRLCVYRSLNNLQAQIIDDTAGKVLLGMSTFSKDVKSRIKNAGNVKGATDFGETFAAQAKARGIIKVAFDRGGYIYHGRIKAFADGARKGGLEF